MRDTAHDLSLDQHRIHRTADVIADKEAFDARGTRVAIDPYHRHMNTIGVGHAGGLVPALGGEPGFALAARARGRRERRGNIAQRKAGARVATPNHPPVDDVQPLDRTTEHRSRHVERLGANPQCCIVRG